MLQMKFGRESEHHLRTLRNIELQSWFVNLQLSSLLIIAMINNHRLSIRKIDYRHAEPLGMDILGNTYHVYTPLVDGTGGCGDWIICCKAENLVHPLGYLPPNNNPSASNKAAKKSKKTSTSSDSDDEDNASSVEDVLEKDHSWYAIDGPEDIHELIRWIKFRAEKTWSEVESGTFQSPVKKHKKSSSISNVKAVARKSDFRIFVDNHRVNLSERYNPRDVVTKESIEGLCEKLETIGGMLGAFEEEIKLRKANKLL